MSSDNKKNKSNRRVVKVNMRDDYEDNLRDIDEEDPKSEQIRESAKDFFSNFKHHKSPSQTRKRPSKVKPKHILIIFIIICIALILGSAFYTNTFRPFQSVASVLIVPAQKGVNSIGLWISDKLELFKKVEDLTAENKELKKQISDLESDNSLLKNQSAEYSNAANLLELKDLYSDYDGVGANVIARESTKWFSTFTIDKGSKDGIEPDMNVLTGNGLCGIVVSVGYNYSTVRAIIDDDSSVSAQFQDSGDLCSVNGSLTLVEDNLLQFTNVAMDVDISRDESVVTSRISSKFLPGLLIGYVADYKIDGNDLTKSGHLTPVADFTNIREVLVLKVLKQDYIADHPDEFPEYQTEQADEEETTKKSSGSGKKSEKETTTELQYEIVEEPEIVTDPDTEFVETTVEYDEEGNVITD